VTASTRVDEGSTSGERGCWRWARWARARLAVAGDRRRCDARCGRV